MARQKKTRKQADHFAFELFKNSLNSIADEMALTIHRTAYSSVVKGSMDYSTAICDASGRMIVQGLCLPLHLGSIPAALAAVLRHYGNDLKPGDVYALNDPFDGGSHLPDIFIFKPVFFDQRLIAFAATICHHTDVGGRVAGSNAADSTECYQEGLRIPPLKLYESGVANDTLLQIIEKNVRVPVLVQGDIRAQLSACHTGEAGLIELFETYGVANSLGFMNGVLDYTERLTRAAIRELPDGTYEFEDWLDDDGINVDKPVSLRVTFRKQGERLVADWTDSSLQVKGALNCTESFSKATVYIAVKCILNNDIPANEGFFRSIEIITRPGTICNALPPAATAARGLTGLRQVDCCFGALAKMVPDRVFAASDGGPACVSVGGYRANRTPFIYVDFHSGAWGGRPWADGLQGNSHVASNNSSTSIEVTEVDQPLQILAYELIQDSMGAGQFRGGASIRRDYRMREQEGTIQVRNDRCKFHPYGLYGGRAGQVGRTIYNPDSKIEYMPGKFTRTFYCNDVLRYEIAGAGGWGDPLERGPLRVLSDVRNEYVSAAAAREQYGVVVDVRSWTVNEGDTVELRRMLRERRGWTKRPFIDRGDLPREVKAPKEQEFNSELVRN